MSSCSTSARASRAAATNASSTACSSGSPGIAPKGPYGRFVGATTAQPSARGSSTPRLRGWVARGVLCALDVGPALQLVVDERRAQVPAPPRQSRREGDRVLHGELRARADRKMGGVGRVSEQDDVALVPDLVRDLREIE